jgi:hypothetical protein
MTGQTIILAHPVARARAHVLIDRAPDGYVLNVSEPRRTTEQNDKLWAMLSDVSRAKPLGRRHTPDDWKAIAMNACGWECQFCEGLDGRPFPLGFRSSRLTKSQMGTLLDWLQAFGDEHGVQWTDQRQAKAA